MKFRPCLIDSLEPVFRIDRPGLNLSQKSVPGLRLDHGLNWKFWSFEPVKLLQIHGTVLIKKNCSNRTTKTFYLDLTKKTALFKERQQRQPGTKRRPYFTHFVLWGLLWRSKHSIPTWQHPPFKVSTTHIQNAHQLRQERVHVPIPGRRGGRRARRLAEEQLAEGGQSLPEGLLPGGCEGRQHPAALVAHERKDEDRERGAHHVPQHWRRSAGHCQSRPELQARVLDKPDDHESAEGKIKWEIKKKWIHILRLIK